MLRFRVVVALAEFWLELNEMAWGKLKNLERQDSRRSYIDLGSCPLLSPGVAWAFQLRLVPSARWALYPVHA